MTGCAGFIGFHLARKLLCLGHSVAGLDNLNSYYDPALKHARLKQLMESPNFSFYRMDVADPSVKQLTDRFLATHVVHLAAQAGVRFSLENPMEYLHSNATGTANLFEAIHRSKVEHVIYASSSSVYGSNRDVPFSTSDQVNHPISMYAATKRFNELTADVYAHLYRMPCTGLRFFTVYGSWGRPDMAYYSFSRKIKNGDPIVLYNNGDMSRDFTHISDVVESIVRLLDLPPPQPHPHRILNIGGGRPVALKDFVKVIEKLLGKRAIIETAPLQAGDLRITYSDCAPLRGLIDFSPTIEIEEGLSEFIEWFDKYQEI